MYQEVTVVQISKELFQQYLDELREVKAELAELKKGRIAGDRIMTIRQVQEKFLKDTGKAVSRHTLKVWHIKKTLCQRSGSGRQKFYMESDVLNLKIA